MKRSVWLKANATELAACIRRVCPNVGKLSLSDLWDWVQNDEGLYNWAKDEGVRV